MRYLELISLGILFFAAAALGQSQSKADNSNAASAAAIAGSKEDPKPSSAAQSSLPHIAADATASTRKVVRARPT